MFGQTAEGLLTYTGSSVSGANATAAGTTQQTIFAVTRIMPLTIHCFEIASWFQTDGVLRLQENDAFSTCWQSVGSRSGTDEYSC